MTNEEYLDKLMADWPPLSPSQLDLLQTTLLSADTYAEPVDAATAA